MNYQYKKITIKIGSNVLTHKDGTLDLERIALLVNQIAALHKKGVEVVLVSSGAVASGRNELNLNKKLDAVSARQVFSAVGQVKLLNHYYELFRKHGIVCGQVLTTKESFGTRTHYLTQKNCITEMLSQRVIPIINENDAISVTELMFTDNDELSGLMATMMRSEALIILSNIDGIYDGNPDNPESKVIREVQPDKNLSQYIQTGKSSFGRGGMLTKTTIARKVADEGITVIIANGKKDNILTDLLAKGSEVVCTKFVPNIKTISSVKKWIAHSESFSKGEIYINEGAVSALMEKASSLLFVGVTDIKGDFEKDEIVRIIHNGQTIGVGKSNYESAKAKELIGKKGQRPLIHYDYLYLE